jgi:excisionase family DNA binding protein
MIYAEHYNLEVKFLVHEPLTVNQVAKMLNVHEVTIRRHIKQGRLRAIKVGRQVRISREDLEEFRRPVCPPRPTSRISPALEPLPWLKSEEGSHT